MKQIFYFSLIASLMFVAVQCAKPRISDAETQDRNLVLQPHAAFIDAGFTQLANQSFGATNLFKGNNFRLATSPFSNISGDNELSKLTEAGIELGRVLFYDTNLSANNNVACGSCHSQGSAFTDARVQSIGVTGETPSRNTMALTNLAFDNGYFWRNDHQPLQASILGPVQVHSEMGFQNMEQMIEKLKSVTYYPALFADAFGDGEVTEDRVSNAMTQFVARLTSQNSNFDNNADILGQTGYTFSALENQGQAIFQQNCGGCHQAVSGFPVQRGYYDVNGAGTQTLASNIGLDFVDVDAPSAGGFKIPGMRNIALTAPYMHDGRYTTLEQVVEHYSTGIKENANLDSRLREEFTGQPKKFNFSTYDKSALVAFLKTFSDNEFITDARFSDPFKQ